MGRFKVLTVTLIAPRDAPPDVVVSSLWLLFALRLFYPLFFLFKVWNRFESVASMLLRFTVLEIVSKEINDVCD